MFQINVGRPKIQLELLEHVPLIFSSCFQSEQARKLWENATKERAEHIKGLIENRDFVPDWMKRQLEGSLEFTASQTRSMLSEDKTRRTQGALKWVFFPLRNVNKKFLILEFSI